MGNVVGGEGGVEGGELGAEELAREEWEAAEAIVGAAEDDDVAGGDSSGSQGESGPDGVAEDDVEGVAFACCWVDLKIINCYSSCLKIILKISNV